MLWKIASPFLIVLPAFAIWPLPQRYSSGSDFLSLSPTFSIQLSGINDPPQDLLQAIDQTTSYLQNEKLKPLIPDRGVSIVQSIQHASSLPFLNLILEDGAKIQSIAEGAMADINSRYECYNLSVPADGSPATLSANSSLGLFRGLTTFSQLWYGCDGTTFALEAPFDILDWPAYPYRGLMLDTARNYFPVSDIKRTLDAMSWVKINTFHWHIVDSQSFPLLIPGFEELAENGAYSSSKVYSPKDVKEIVDYAAARGIDVIPEIDTPGHTAIIAESHPQHVACFQASPWAEYANEPPAGQLRLASPETTNFTASLLEAASALFPSKFFSTGGDEVNMNCYNNDSITQEQLAKQGKSFEQALDLFTKITHSTLKRKRKTAVVWKWFWTTKSRFRMIP